MTTPPDPLAALDAASRRTVEAFLRCCQECSTEGMKELFLEDCVFEGAFSAGSLRGRKVLESHYRQSFKGVYSRGVLRIHGLVVYGQQIVIDWEVAPPGGGESQPAPGRTRLDLDDSGLLARIKTDWDPKPLMGWEERR